MNTSKFLSKVIGLYLILVSGAMFFDIQRFITPVTGLINDVPLLFVCGFFTLILGLVMVVSHNIWKMDWRVIITVISWWILFKGIILIYYPQLLDSITQNFVQNITVAYIAAGVDLVFGLLLVYLGFKK